MDQLEDINTNKYVWTEHVAPREEDQEMVEKSIEELKIQQPKKISLEEAEYKKALMQFGSEKKHSTRNINVTELEESKDTSRLIIEIMAELHNSDLNIKIDHADKDQIEKQTTSKLAKIGLLAQKQGQYLTNVYKTFIKELEGVVVYYKEETIKVAQVLELEQKARAIFEGACKEQAHKIEKLELMLQNHDASNNEQEEKLQQSLKQIGKLESILQTERELRKQADLRTKEIFEKAKKLKVISEQERKQKEIAELQVQKAVCRAKEVMHYFFNSAVDDSVGKIANSSFKNDRFPEFDSLMLSRKSMF